MSKKITEEFPFPEVLDLSQITTIEDGVPLDQDPKRHQYELIGVIMHKSADGNAMSGHYWAFIKDQCKLWWCVNDHRVQRRSFDEMCLHAFGGENAYMDQLNNPEINGRNGEKRSARYLVYRRIGKFEFPFGSTQEGDPITSHQISDFFYFNPDGTLNTRQPGDPPLDLDESI